MTKYVIAAIVLGYVIGSYGMGYLLQHAPVM